ncbi:MAG: MATE family efflux transporter [Oscillibacter sp.]|nr:MATE family efflux transporter [Oscillibacter sp.]
MFKHLRGREPGFYKRLLMLSLPLILQNIITFSLGLADTFMVSQLGNMEMAAVTTANIPVFVLNSIIFGTQNGLGILCSQYWGRGDTRSINRCLGVACMVGAAITLTISLLMALFPVPIMDLLSNRHDLSLLGAPYLQIIGFSYMFNMLSSAYISARRSVEDTAFGMKVFAVSGGMNIVLNYLLIYGKCGFPALGVAGAAIATLLSRVAEVVICVVSALRCKQLPFEADAFLRPGMEMLRRFLRYSAPVVLNETVWGTGSSLITVILGHAVLSVELLAAHAVMGNMNRLLQVVCYALGGTTAVLIGKSIGEGKTRDQVQALGRTLLSFSTAIGAGIAVAALLLIPVLFQPVIFPLFKLVGETARIATALAVTGFAAIPIRAYIFTALIGVLRAGGDVNTAVAIDLLPLWLAGVPAMALVVLVLQLGCWPIAITMILEDSIKVPICAARIRTGKWVHDVTREGGPS